MKKFWIAATILFTVCVAAACAPVWIGDKKDDSSSRIVEEFQEKSLEKALSLDKSVSEKKKVKIIVKKEKLTCEEIEKRMFEKCMPEGEIMIEGE